MVGQDFRSWPIVISDRTPDAEKPAGLQAGGPLGTNMRDHSGYLLLIRLADNGNGVVRT